MHICIDPGHGGSSSGAVGKYSFEKDINLSISLKLESFLARMGIAITITRKGDFYLSLQERCDIANNSSCDYFLSIHCNSFSDPNVSGTETYYYQGSREGFGLASRIQYAAVGYNNNINRGVKTADFYVLKYTAMPAVLLECGFISNKAEEDMLNNKDWQDGFTQSVGAAIAQHLGVDPTIPPYQILYKVYLDDIQKGAFLEKENAIKLAADILGSINKGHVKVISSNGETIMDVTKTEDISSPIPVVREGLSIMQLKRATIAQMEKFVHDNNPAAPYFAEKYIKYGDLEGVRGDIAFAQAILETNYFKFTGVVKPEQNNFAGIGATGPGQRGVFFATPDEGIIAQMQHLKAYAVTDKPNLQLVDPRFNLVKRGSAPNWPDLNGKWAVPGNGYGEAIIDIWRRILEVKV